MNKTALAILFALTPAALYVVFAFFNPLPPFSVQYVAGINSFAATIVNQARGLFGNITALGGTVIGSVAGGALTNYVRGKMQKNVEAQAKEIIGDKDTQITSLYETLGAKGEKITYLEGEAAKVSQLETKVLDQEQTIRQLEDRNQELIWQKASLNKKDKDEIKQDVLETIRKK